MSQATTGQSERSERRIHQARLACYLALMPVVAGLAAAATAGALGAGTQWLSPVNPTTLAITLMYAGLFFLAAWLLGRRQRAGVVLGLTLFGLMLLTNLRAGGSAMFSMLFAVAGLVVVARAWPEMTSSQRLAA